MLCSKVSIRSLIVFRTFLFMIHKSLPPTSAWCQRQYSQSSSKSRRIHIKNGEFGVIMPSPILRRQNSQFFYGNVYYNNKNPEYKQFLLSHRHIAFDHNDELHSHHQQQPEIINPDSDGMTNNSTSTSRIYNGPVLEDPSEIIGGVSLEQLGVDLAIAPSTIAPGSLGLYIILSDGVEEATIPSMTLLSGYSRNGTFQDKDEGDKTVAFALASSDTAVFYERELMSVLDALKKAAKTKGKDGTCGLAGHALVATNDNDNLDKVDILIENDCEGNSFKRYFVPESLSEGGYDDPDFDSIVSALSVQNLGQFANDLAWSYQDPPKTKEEYEKRSEILNTIQLVWRLDYDSQINSLVPTWPVSTASQEITFLNKDVFMEIGTKYGWSYWQATVDMNEVDL